MATRQQVIFTEGAELILLLKGNAGRESYNFPADKVQSVFFGYEDSKFVKLFTKKIRRITITVGRFGPVMFDERRHPKYFDQYIEMMKKFCAENKVTFHDFPDKK